MSYILDALRRADAERERGEVPGLQSQQHAMLDDDDVAPRSRPLVWVVVALAVALAAAVAWNFLGGEPPRSAVSAVSASLPPPVATMPVAPALPTALPPAAAPVAAIPSSPAVATAPTMAVESRKPAVRKVAAAPPTTAPASGPTPGTTAANTVRAAADGRIIPFAELPDAIRRDLPKLAFGGSSYSGSASSRMVILNGQVFHEGDTVAPGLTLRQIKPKAAVLGFRDVRFELSY